jgi:transposase InsO family protein
MPPRRRGENGRFISNFEADRLDGIETPLPDTDQNFETASERGDEDMGDESRRTGVDELPRIEDGLNRLKPTNFKCELLDYDNVKNWKARIKQLLSLQQCWRVMEATIEMVKNKQTTLLEKAMDDTTWYTSNLLAVTHITTYIKTEDQSAIRDMTVSGEVWIKLMTKYEAVNRKRRMGMVKKLFNWRMDTSMKIVTALEEVERLYREVHDLSEKKIQLDESAIMTIFLGGLPKEYAVRVDAIESMGETDRDVILMRLQEKELDLLAEKANESLGGATGESANRARRPLICWNCEKEGHKAEDCRKSKKEGQRDRSKDRRLDRGRERSYGRNRRNRGGGRDRERTKGKARATDEESRYDDDDERTAADNDEYDGNSNESGYFTREILSNESICRIELSEQISNKFESLIDEKVLRTRENTDPVIDGGATSHCSSDIEQFESLDTRYIGWLGTAGKATRIAGKGVMRISLSSGKILRLNNVLYVPGMTQTLLSTQILFADGISNAHVVGKGYRFFREDRKTLATGYNIGRTSYLGWVRNKDALVTQTLDSEREYARLAKRMIDWKLLHDRLGHPGLERFERMMRLMKKSIKKDMQIISEIHRKCETCIQAKSIKKQNRKPVPRASAPLRRVYMDFWGPYTRVPNKYRWEYYLSLTDDHSRLSWIYLTRNRTAETVRGILELWLAKVERETGHLLITIRTDNAKEFEALRPWAEGKGIEIEFIEPYTPPQNGVAERLNRFLLEVARAILISAKVPKRYWPWAVKMANHIRNRTIIVRNSGGKTPYEIWNGHPPDISKFRKPFSKVWFHIEQDDKMESRAIEGAFIGYCASSNQYSILARKDRKVYTATNPIFIEDEPSFLAEETSEIDLADEPAFKEAYGGPLQDKINEAPKGNRDEKADREGERVVDEEGEGGSGSERVIGHIHQDLTNQTESGSDNSHDEATHEDNSPVPAPPRKSDRIRKPTQAAVDSQQTELLYGRKPRQVRRREEREESVSRDNSSRAVEREERLIRDTARLAVAAELLLGNYDEFSRQANDKKLSQIPIPQTYEEAVNDPKYGARWREAIHVEISTLIQFGTWRYVQRPKDQSVVTCKWTFLVKYDADGRVERFKARLVARGFSQREGLDFEDTFAPVIRLESLRILFALAVMYNLTAHLLDATNAYVGSQIDKQIFMETPEGVKTDQPGQVCELLRSLYGLKQSAHLWQQKVKKFVTAKGFRQSTADPGVFINDRGIIIAVYVDDILIFGKNTRDIKATKVLLKEFHPMKDSGRVSKILGIRVTWLPDGSIRLDQEVYARSILEEFGMQDCRPKELPMSPSTNLSDETSPKLTIESHRKFRHIIGKLTYLAGGTRVDIQFTVNRLSQHLAEPRQVHLAAANHLLRYLRRTLSYAITYMSGTKGSNSKLVGYSDSSFANGTKHRSTSGYVFIIAGGPVSWSSRKQPITALSTTEAEYVAAAEAAKQAVWLRHFLYAIRKHQVYDRRPTTLRMNPEKPTELGIDNQGALALAANPTAHGRSKHIRIRYHAIRDFIEHGEINAYYVPTDEMLADSLTKAVKPNILNRMVKALRLDGVSTA